MRALKFLVIGMGVLIAAGLVVIIVTLVSRSGPSQSGDDAGKRAVATDEVTTKIAPAEIALAEITLPPGANIIESDIAGDRLLLRLRLADGTTVLRVIGLSSGRDLGTIKVRQKGDMDGADGNAAK